jgi:hypothetical protein
MFFLILGVEDSMIGSLIWLSNKLPQTPNSIHFSELEIEGIRTYFANHKIEKDNLNNLLENLGLTKAAITAIFEL